MKKIFTMAFMAALFLNAKAQVDFENLSVDTTLYWKGNVGVPGLTTFNSGMASFVNRNDTSSFGDYWSGWAYSAKQDTVSISYANNDISCIAGKGNNNSSKYGVAYFNAFDPSLNRIQINHVPSTFGQVIKGFYLNNTTIAYRSMQNGDFIAKKFGGISGNDSDYFRVNFIGWRNGVPLGDTITFYLADFRDTNNSNDYIVKNWTYIDLMPLGPVDSIDYFMESSDTSSAGINTPTYFCLDDMEILIIGSVKDVSENTSIRMFPNPVVNIAFLENQTNASYSWNLYDTKGSMLQSGKLLAYETAELSLQQFPKGLYYLQLNDGSVYTYKKIIK